MRQVARDLSRAEILSPEIRRLVADMVETMREYGGVGLAAPQVHESLRLAVIEVEALGERYKVDASQPLIVFFNAKVKVLDPAPHGFWEGCLSVPGMRGFVERPRKIQVDYLDDLVARIDHDDPAVLQLADARDLRERFGKFGVGLRQGARGDVLRERRRGGEGEQAGNH